MAVAIVVTWALGAYIPAISNVWVYLNILTPAGQTNLADIPFAYPAVGIDGSTLCSLAGIVVTAAAITTWISYLERYTPPAQHALGTQPPASRPNSALPPSFPTQS